jgi:hypothetical protein
MKVAVALVLVAAMAVPARAQSPAPGDAAPATGAEAQATSGPGGQAPAVDATKLGVSLSRIQKGLRVSEAREQATGTPLRLEYQVQVYGAAPRIDILQDFDISRAAPLQYGAPTHQDFLTQLTPQAYRSPRWPVGALAGWALFQVAKRAEKSKCEQEIAEYRALVMQGVAAAAPRCTQ